MWYESDGSARTLKAKRMALLMAVLALACGCTPSSKMSTVKIQMPGVPAPMSAAKIGALSTDANWNASVPANLSEIGCYAVFVGGPEPEMSGSSCKSEGGTELMRFGPTAGFFSSGAVVEIEVPAGSDRRFYVIGLKLLNGRCELRMPASHDFTFANYSYPYVIGRATSNLQPGTNEIKVVLNEGFSSTNKVDDCNFFTKTAPPPTATPAPTPAPLAVASMALGAAHTCSRFVDGRVKCWGMGSQGATGLENTAQIGDVAGEMGAALPFVNLGTGRTAKEIVAGNGFTCVILDNDQVKCWGQNFYGQLGLGNTTSRGTTPGSMGDSLPVVNLGTGRTALMLAAGDSHVCALRDNNSVVCWGQNTYGQLGVSSTIASAVGDAPAEMGDSLSAVFFDGLTPVKIAAGWKHTCAVMADGTGRCWGDNSAGQFGDGTSTSSYLPQPADVTDAADIHIGRGTTCWTLSSGLVRCSGDNSVYQYGSGTTASSATPVSAVSSLTSLGGALQLSVASQHACAVRTLESQLYCWGSGFMGRTGLNKTTTTSLPTVVPIGSGVVQSFTAGATSGSHMCARLSSGHIKCWGGNDYGQLGYGDTSSRGESAASMEGLSFVDVGGGGP